MTGIMANCIERKLRTKRRTRSGVAPKSASELTQNRAYSRTRTPQTSVGLFQPNRHHDGRASISHAASGIGGRCRFPNMGRLISLSLLCICMIGITVTAGAQQTNAIAAREQSSSHKNAIEAAVTATPQLSQKAPNQSRFGTFTTEGIAIQVAKTPNPLQLINPAAPANYGWPEANVVRDPIDKRVSGLKIFSLRF